MILDEPTHIAYSDECQFNVGRYRGIGLSTWAKADEEQVNQQLSGLLAESNVDELKWEKVRSAKYRFAALKIVDCAIRLACAGVIRIDVLIWDTLDSRHDVRGRDDLENLQRMYYHIFRNVLLNRWPPSSTWHLSPDEHTGIDWQNMEDILEHSGSRLEVEDTLFTRGKLHLRLRTDFKIQRITPVISDVTPGVQLADFFVGLAVYSRTSYETFTCAKVGSDARQEFLSLESEPTVTLSNADTERCRVLAEFNAACKGKKMGVSLRTHRGLRTLSPEGPLNFWWYEPQHDADRAPTKSK